MPALANDRCFGDDVWFQAADRHEQRWLLERLRLLATQLAATARAMSHKPMSWLSATTDTGAVLSRCGSVTGNRASDTFPQTLQIRGTKCPVIETVAGATSFSPDHPPVIWTDRTVES
jgi:hypothetical protein